MKSKKTVVLAIILAMLFGNIINVYAAANKNQYGYGYVKKTEDLVTSFLTKQYSEDASNLVGSVEGSRSLCSWVENNIGMRMTNKVEYNSGDPVYMSYSNDSKGDMRLIVSTTLLNFQTTGTFGYWSPDYITEY